MIIYLTTNLITQEKYIGKDRNNSSYYIGSGVNLKKAIKEYGRENFKKEILEVCVNLIDLKQKEIYWLNYYDAANNINFYNLTNKSHGSINGPTKTEAYLNRGISISSSRKGNHYPEASKSQKGLKKPKVSIALTGKKKTDNHCYNLSQSKLGIPSKRKGKPDLKQKGIPKPGAGGKNKPKLGAGPKEGKHIINIETNEIFTSVKECMEKLGFHKKQIYIILKDPNSKLKYKINSNTHV
jgi:hypothetical protein